MFGYSDIRLMCWFHVTQALKKNIIELVKSKEARIEIDLDIHEIHRSQNKETNGNGWCKHIVGICSNKANFPGLIDPVVVISQRAKGVPIESKRGRGGLALMKLCLQKQDKWYKESLLEPIVPPVVEPVVAPVKPVIKRKRVEEVEEKPTKSAGRPKKIVEPVVEEPRRSKRNKK